MKPTIIKEFPGKAVEEYRKTHNGRLPSEEPETRWECPFCGREMKGLDVFPNEACCGEVGRAQKVMVEE